MKAVGLRTRLLFWGALLVAMTALSGLASALTFARVSSRMGDALSGDQESSVLLETMIAALEDEDDALLLSLSGDESRARTELRTERRVFDDACAALDARTSGTDDRTTIATLKRDVAAYRARGDDLIGLDGAPPAADIYRRELAPLLRQATGECTHLRENSFHATEAVAANARDEARRATVLVSATSLGALAVLAFVAWRLARTVLRPLSELTQSVDAVRSADFSRRVESRADDELGKLALGFNRMSEALAEFHASRLGDVLAANQTLEATLEALPEAVLVVGEGGAITRTNARARDLLGAPRTIDDVPLPAAALAAIRDAAAGSLPKNPSRADLGRATTLGASGDARLFLPRIIGVGKAGVVVVLDEVTEFARLDEMRTEFIAAAAHELRTPLTTLRMTLALLEEAAPALSERQREMLATARIGGEQLASTVDEFLDVSRIEAGPLVLAKDRIDLPQLVQQIARGLRVRFEEQGVALDVDAVTNAALVVHGDRARIAAAFSNLLTNALKYSPKSGHVAVRAEAARNGARIVVDDDGPGVPVDLRERVFEKYFRVEQVRPDHEGKAHGAGIGLYLCRQIAEAHAGSVRCEASSSGGARFVLDLPRA